MKRTDTRSKLVAELLEAAREAQFWKAEYDRVQEKLIRYDNKKAKLKK
jgi:TolB-like protein